MFISTPMKLKKTASELKAERMLFIHERRQRRKVERRARVKLPKLSKMGRVLHKATQLALKALEKHHGHPIGTAKGKEIVEAYADLIDEPLPETKVEQKLWIIKHFFPTRELVDLNNARPVKEKRKRKWNPLSSSYNEYINSAKWFGFRRSLIKIRGHKCEKCGDTPKVIHAHHLTYENFKHEKPEDILLVCVPCHEIIHNKKIG